MHSFGKRTRPLIERCVAEAELCGLGRIDLLRCSAKLRSVVWVLNQLFPKTLVTLHEEYFPYFRNFSEGRRAVALMAINMADIRVPGVKLRLLDVMMYCEMLQKENPQAVEHVVEMVLLHDPLRQD